MKPASQEAVQLMMEGSAAMADAEQNGIRIDVPYLERQIAWTKEKIRDIETKLRKDAVYKLWRREFGEKADISSPAQLARVVFDVMGEKSKNKTATGRHSTSADSLEDVDLPFVRRWLDMQSLVKLRSTNLIGIRRETVDGFLHPFFHLHKVKTFRSSSSDPNFQNLPIRDKRQAKIVRRLFIPRDDHVLVEVDFSGIEVRSACPYHQDPVMIKYIEDDFDLHKEMGAQLFKLKIGQVSKPIRQVGKGGFVFPSFYGDWYKSICQKVWRAVDAEKLETTEGVKVRDHLRKIGITELGACASGDPRPGTFEHHVWKVYEKFWGQRFPVYSQWKDDWWEEYLRNGYCRTHTGFVSQGIYKRNEIINFPVQATAFHWLLWFVIRMNRWLKKHKMRSLLSGQVHDSANLDVHRDELQDVLNKAYDIITHDLRRHWAWINVPLAAEVQVAETTWFDKKEWVRTNGVWAEKKKD